ncbi:helix-turn-helix domain-containing protein [Leifsonia sp. NPDC080035]|uniref:Helix-turn-helix domain-containing protein n=1 Tax=Leifsonia sp. NPDC080035 TaxID=3143936 RepID=A0AAU7GF70_9MICO
MRRRDATRHPRRTLLSRPRLLLLDRLLRDSPQTAPQLADSVHLHHNTVREHLDRLVDDGLVVRETEHRTQRGRPHVLFSAAAGGVGLSASAAAQTRRALALGEAYRHAYGFPDPADEADGTAQIDVLEDYLDRRGFRPRVDRDALAVRLACPFGELQGSMEQHTICGVDAAVMRSVLGRVDGPLRVMDVRSDGAGTCVLRLIRGAEASAPSCPGCPPDPRTSSAG